MKYHMVPISPNQYHSHSILASSRRPQLVDCFLFVVFPIISCPGGHLGSCQTALQMSSAPSSICIKLFANVDNYYYPNTINCKNGTQNNGEFFFSAETLGLPDMRAPGPDGPHKHWDPPALNWEGGSSTYNHYH